MNFPAYVPAAVRAHITTLIEGDSNESHGWAASLTNLDETIVGIDRAIETYTRLGEDDYLTSLKIQKSDAQEHRDRLAADVDCLHRLGGDLRMRGAFALLTAEFSDEKEWSRFIYAAWAARIDFTKYRERLKRATELKNDIAESAKILANLIREFSKTGVNGPNEFYSVSELLLKTDNFEMLEHNLYMWKSMRHHILGELPPPDVPETKDVVDSLGLVSFPKIVTFQVEERGNIDPEEETRNTLRYVWGIAPEFSALLDTVAQASLAFRPGESGMIGAAVESRQHSAKTAYIRAFGNLLTNSHGFVLSPPIMNAMAIVANVVINLPEIDVTNDDVRKALKKLLKSDPENSDEK